MSKQQEEALRWYATQVSLARRPGLDGDIARAKLDRDGGHMARRALGEEPAPVHHLPKRHGQPAS